MEKARRKADISVIYARVLVAPDRDAAIPLACLGCGAELDVHQPDAELPERMLGTCDACKCWHTVFYEPGADVALVVAMPGAGPFTD